MIASCGLLLLSDVLVKSFPTFCPLFGRFPPIARLIPFVVDALIADVDGRTTRRNDMITEEFKRINEETQTAISHLHHHLYSTTTASHVSTSLSSSSPSSQELLLSTVNDRVTQLDRRL